MRYALIRCGMQISLHTFTKYGGICVPCQVYAMVYADLARYILYQYFITFAYLLELRQAAVYADLMRYILYTSSCLHTFTKYGRICISCVVRYAMVYTDLAQYIMTDHIS